MQNTLNFDFVERVVNSSNQIIAIYTYREQGDGRSDILLLDEREARAIVIEVKHSRTLKGQAEKCGEALRQIRTKRYAEGLEEEYDKIQLYGISFFKKRCEVKTEKFK